MKTRADRLLERLPEAGIDVLLVASSANLRYLTGYSGSNGLALLGDSARTFLTDFRYVEQAAAEVDQSFEQRIVQLDVLDAAPDALPSSPLKLGFEEAHLTVRQLARLRELLPTATELVGVQGLVEGLRVVKEPQEVERIRAATALADQAFEALISDGLVGRTERELAFALEVTMRELGARRPSFETIVAAGAHGALPHAQPRDVRVRADELVVIDWGAELDGYCSDCTRTVATGKQGEQELAVYALVKEAQLAGLEALAAGRGGREIDGVARAVIDAAGHGERFGHGLGHGVGIEIHEAPRLSRRSEDRLQSGTVVTVEPGVYVPGHFGVRIEDLVVVSDDGCEVLTQVSKELLSVA